MPQKKSTNKYVGQPFISRVLHELYEVEQILGKALGYPWYKDDKKNFPNATEEDGVCVGAHTATTLAMEAADKLRKQNGNN